MFVSVLEEVSGSILRLTRTNGGWDLQPVDLPANGTVSLTSTDAFSNVVMATYQSFKIPNRL